MMSTRTNRLSSIAAAAIAAAALVAGATTPAYASDPSVDAAKVSKLAKPPKPTKYCVKQKVTGSILAQKTCKTREQWIATTGHDPALEK
jgi:hypothetical protein